MAATVKTMIKGSRKLVIDVTNTWSGADETNTVIVDRSTLVGPNGGIPAQIRIDDVTFVSTPGLEILKLSWDFATDEVIEIFSGPGYIDYKPFGGKSPSGTPASVTEGDVLLSTVGGAAGDAYSLLIHCTLKS